MTKLTNRSIQLYCLLTLSLGISAYSFDFDQGFSIKDLVPKDALRNSASVISMEQSYERRPEIPGYFSMRYFETPGGWRREKISLSVNDPRLRGPFKPTWVANYADAGGTGYADHYMCLNKDGFDGRNPSSEAQILATRQGACAGMHTQTSHAKFHGANLNNVDLRAANMEEGDFSGADLSEAHLQNADLQDAILSGANLDKADLRGVVTWRTDFSKASFRGADLSETWFRTKSFREADFTGADIGRGRSAVGSSLGGDLTGAIFDKANMEYFINGNNGGKTPLNENDWNTMQWENPLTGARFRGSRLAHSTFQMANLDNTDFSDAYLWDSFIAETTGNHANFSKAMLHNVVFQNVRFRGASFKGADLSDATMSSNNDWRGADFSGAILNGVVFHPGTDDLRGATYDDYTYFNQGITEKDAQAMGMIKISH